MMTKLCQSIVGDDLCASEWYKIHIGGELVTISAAINHVRLSCDGGEDVKVLRKAPTTYLVVYGASMRNDSGRASQLL